MAIIPTKAFQCNKCQHIWLPSKRFSIKDPPVHCPQCKSAYWNRKVKIEKIKKIIS